MKKTFTIALVLCITNFLAAQTTFNKIIYKQSSSFVSRPMYDWTKTNTGGYAFTQFFGNNMYVAVMDSTFKILFSRIINVRSDHKSAGFSIAQSSFDSSYCIAGISADPNRPEYDLLIVRMDKKGKERSIDTYLYDNADGGDIKVLPLKNGNFLLAVEGHGNIGLINLGVRGKFSKIRSLSLPGSYLLFNDMVATGDGYLVTGNVDNNSTQQRDIYCVKLDSSLKIKWSKLYSSGKLEGISGAVAAQNNEYFLCGSQADDLFSQTFNARFFKIDSTGNIIWHRLGHFNDNGTPSFAVQANDKGFVMAGGSDMFKVTGGGKLSWISNQQTLLSYSLIKTPDNGFVTFREYNPYQLDIIKINRSGISCNPDYASIYTVMPDSLTVQPAVFKLMPATLQHIDTGNIFTEYDTSATLLCSDAALMSKEKNFSFSNVKQNAAAIIYPDPAKNILNVSINNANIENINLQITDVQGRLIKANKFVAQPGKSIQTLDVSNLVNGVYFLKIISSRNNISLPFEKQ